MLLLLEPFFDGIYLAGKPIAEKLLKALKII